MCVMKLKRLSVEGLAGLRARAEVPEQGHFGQWEEREAVWWVL